MCEFLPWNRRTSARGLKHEYARARTGRTGCQYHMLTVESSPSCLASRLLRGDGAIVGRTPSGLPQLLATDKGKDFARIVDPYSFLNRLTMPKLLLLGSNDPYWTLESTDLYYNDLPGDKHIVFCPNTGHGAMLTTQARQALISFSIACSQAKKLPAVKWAYGYNPDGLCLTMRPAKTPTEVRVWTASSHTRDFREAKWTDQKIEATNGLYRFTLARPSSGYAAVFGEVSYPGDFAPLSLSTAPRILAANRTAKD
jgi:PhoPQ-activated pathogenicity-related protein